MEDNSHKDKLDQFFGQDWDDEKLSREMDIPELEDSWDVIQERLRDRRKRPLWWLFLLPLLILLIAGGLFVWSDESSERLVKDQARDMSILKDDEKVPGKSEVENIKAISTEKEKAEHGSVSEEIEHVSKETTLGNISDNTPEPLRETGKYKTTSEKTGNEITARSETNTLNEDPSLDDPAGASSEHKSKSSSKFIDHVPHMRAVSILPFLNRIGLEEFLVMSEEEEMKDVLQPPSMTSADSDKVPWSIEGVAGVGLHAFLTTRKETSIENLDLTLEDGRYFFTEIRLNHQYRSDRSVFLGLTWREHKFRSHYELGVNYTQTGEIQDGQGNWHQGYSHTLPTLFGDSPMQHVLVREMNDGLNEGELIPFALYLEHEIQDLSLTIGHAWDYSPGHWQFRFGGFLKGGYWMTREEIKEVKLISHHEKVYHNTTTYDIPVNSLERPWHLSSGLDIEIARNISPGHKIGLRTSLEHALMNPILDNNIELRPQYVGAGLFWKVQL